MIHHLWLFIAVAAIVIVVPGPDTTIVTKNALLHGQRAALGTAFGVEAGLAVWTVALSGVILIGFGVRLALDGAEWTQAAGPAESSLVGPLKCCQNSDRNRDLRTEARFV